MYHCCIKLSLYRKEVMSKAYNMYALSRGLISSLESSKVC